MKQAFLIVVAAVLIAGCGSKPEVGDTDKKLTTPPTPPSAAPMGGGKAPAGGAPAGGPATSAAKPATP